jgi:hypothetical protein
MTRQLAGHYVDTVGRLMLPIAIGAVFGYYASDSGVPLLPDVLAFALGWGIVAISLMLVGRFLAGTVRTGPEQRVRRRVVAIWALGLTAVALRLGVWWSDRDSDLTRLTPAEFEAGFALDAALYVDHAREMELLVDQLEAAGVGAYDAHHVLTAEEEALLADTWSALLNHTVALDQIRRFWEDWYRWDPSRLERSYHLRSFLLTLAAEVCLVETGARFTALVDGHPNVTKFLDAAHPEHGLPAGTLEYYRRELLGTRDQARVMAGERYLQVLAVGVKGRREASELGVDWLWSAAEGHLAAIRSFGVIGRATDTLTADTSVLRVGVDRVWFPVQKGVAETMGDTRVRRPGRYLIEHDVIEPFDARMEPGDVLFSRKNWYLSNVGLPGFWPHAMLYVGTPDKLDAWADGDPAIAAWILAETGREVPLSQMLRARHPGAWRDWTTGDADPKRVIEAVSEGVLFNTLAHVGGDYFAAVRPNLDRLARAQAIDASFRYHGRPYDFDFDFATDATVVCSELVWRAYRPAEGKQGLDIDTVRFAGRSTLPANDLLEVYTRAPAGPDAPFTFVLFLDASERDQRVFEADEAALRASVDRPRWDAAQP